jgi:hypothetical protein
VVIAFVGSVFSPYYAWALRGGQPRGIGHRMRGLHDLDVPAWRAVAVARAAVGFEEGGYTGNGGTSEVAGVVHGREFVLNAQATRRNRGLLEHLNNGGSVQNFSASLDNSAVVAELRTIRTRLGEETRNRTAVELEVGMNEMLYIRKQRRAAIRNLRT